MKGTAFAVITVFWAVVLAALIILFAELVIKIA